MRSELLGGALELSSLLLSGACGSSSSSTCGTTGLTQACICAGGAGGAQTCGADGAWQACRCGATTDTVGGNTSAATDTGAFSEVSCVSPFDGSSLTMAVEVKLNGVAQVAAPNVVSGPIRLIFKHANFTDEVSGDISGTISNGKLAAELTGLPKTVSIGLDNQVNKATFTSPWP